MFQRLVHMKTRAFSRCVGVLVALLLCAFSIFYVWQLDFGFSLHRHNTVISGFVPHFYGAGDNKHPVIEWPSARRRPSVDYINLAFKDLLPRRPYNVYPDRNGQRWTQRWHGSQQPCLGPRGVHVNSNSDDMLEAWVADPVDLNPEPMFGSFAESGLDSTHCFDRSGRLGLYGFDTVRDRALLRNSGVPDVDWSNVDWGQLQAQCAEANKARFSRSPGQNLFLAYPETEKSLSLKRNTVHNWRRTKRSLFSQPEKYKDRTAVLLRAWQGMEYTPELLQSVRSMISELSLHTGGDYSVYLMVEVKDKDRPIVTDGSEAYQKALDDIVPREFHNMTILFNQDLLKAWYPKIDQGGGQSLHMNQPLQLFSIMNSDFVFVWQFELDVRYTGNWYNLLENAESWARKQPRKLQFERAAKFYIPSYHGSYANFSDSIEAANPDGGVWGPVRSGAVPKPLGPRPPKATAAQDDYAWGVGEEADVISVSPIIDLNHTELFKKNTISGFPEGQDPPRRSLMVTPVVRLSSHLLQIMHDIQRDQGMDIRSEMFAHTMALLHGLKVAHFPIPQYLDHQGEVGGPGEADRLFNMVGPNGTFTDFAAQDMIKMRARSTFWWRLEFDQYPQTLYRRWYGLEGKAPAVQEIDPNSHKDTPYPYPAGLDKVGRLCLPGMLLHPVKGVKAKE